jgi:hypothetical protein
MVAMRRFLSRFEVVALAGVLSLSVACEKAPASQASTGSRDPGIVAARVGDREITLKEVDEKAVQTNMKAFQELYNARRQALEELVAEALLDDEARSRGTTREELVAQEIESKIAPVTSEEVELFFNQNRARLGQQTLEQIGPQIREFLEARNGAMARESYLEGLRAKANVAISLDPPRVPIVVARGERLKGPMDAPVTIVEYSDFQ